MAALVSEFRTRWSPEFHDRDGPSSQHTTQDLRQPTRPTPLRCPAGHRLRRVGLGATTGHAANPDTEQDARAVFMRGEWNRAGFTPHRMTLEEALRYTRGSRFRVLGSSS